MKLSSFLVSLVTFSILALPAFAQDAVRPNPPNSQVETKAAQALLNAEIKLQKIIPRNSPQKPNYDLYSENFNDIAIAFARLGRTQSALKATQFMSPNSAPQTRSEVLRLSVRRSAILGDVKYAASLIPQIKNSNAKADALLTVARAYLRQFDYPAAQKVLFQVTPLVPENFDVLLNSAYLFSQSGNFPVSKRLFDRAKKMMLPIPEKIQKDKDDEISTTVAFSQRRSFQDYLLKSGFVDEWEQFRKSTPRTRPFLDARTLDRLFQLNQIDLAIEAARDTSSENYPEMKMAALAGVALQISPKYPDKALSLLDETSADWDALSQTYNVLANINRIKGDLAVYLASGYRQLGKETLAQEWLQKAVKNATPDQAAQWKLEYSIFPLLISTNIEKKSTFPADQLLQINTEIQDFLPVLIDKSDARNLLRQLIAAQIKAGQISEARGNIEFLEKDAKQQIASEKPRFSAIGDALSVAELWKKIGDQKQCDALLQSMSNAPQSAWSFSKTERINAIIQWGFVGEGLHLFHSLPAPQQKSLTQTLPDLPFAIAQAYPDQFPYEILKAQQPSMEASNISKFVRGLTNDLFQTPSE